MTFNFLISAFYRLSELGNILGRLRDSLTFLSVSMADEEEEQMRLFLLISEQCLPKLVCELYAKPFGSSFTDSEKSLMGLIG